MPDGTEDGDRGDDGDGGEDGDRGSARGREGSGRSSPSPAGPEPRPDLSDAPEIATDVEFEEYPLTRSEYISAMVHFYRGELSKADDWRARLDPTTNWAIVTTAAMLSLAFSTPEHSHVTLLLALVVISIFLGFEARRFRYFDVWRSRVRMFEENFWIPMIRRTLVSPRADWRERVAEDLDRPTFKLTFPEAVGIRLRYNYVWLYLAILVAWLAKLNIHPTPAASAGQVVRRMSVGPIDGPVVLAAVGAWFAVAAWLAVRVGHVRVAIDEVRGVEKRPETWKT